MITRKELEERIRAETSGEIIVSSSGTANWEVTLWHPEENWKVSLSIRPIEFEFADEDLLVDAMVSRFEKHLKVHYESLTN